jgi:nucleotide-binding universal stress UspA family protein
MDKRRRFTILVATDGSEEGTAAVKAAAIFPWPAGSRVHAVVVRTALPTADIPESVWTEVDRGLTAVADAARKILSERWPDAEARVVDGPTVEAILARAQRVGARVIVLGSHGHGPIARLLLGSISLGVVRQMKHAALVVRSRPRGFARVVLGVDGSRQSRHAVAFVAGLDVPADGHVTIVHVLERAALKSLVLMPAATRAAIAAQASAVTATETAKARRDAEAAAAELRRAGWKADIVIRYGAPLHELLAATKTAHAQLLTVGARGHGALERLLLGSVAEGALHRTLVSVLVVR